MLRSRAVRVLVDYRPALRARTGVGEYVHELVRARSRDRVISPIWEGNATLELFGAPNEEHTALAPLRMGKGFRFTFAYTVDDLATERRL